ncbi:MAG: hypothetical protein R2762_07100 [Bryobacteraceae bacterium]
MADDSGPQRESAVRRFQRSMDIDYEKWHDGVGYDLDAIREAAPQERVEIERLLLARGAADWRDVEALALLDTERARQALQEAAAGDQPAVRMAVSRHAPDLLGEQDRIQSLVRALEEAEFYAGLTQALDEVEEFHPPEVVEALFRGALARSGEVAVHFAAMIAYVYGKASEPFSWELRPFFLRFNTPSAGERRVAFRDLCDMVGVDAKRYLNPSSVPPK